MATDPFDDVLNLEDQLYQEGYTQGLADGAQAGKLEGRALGLEKGFGKFLESGRLYGKSIIWANRLRIPTHQNEASALDQGPRPTLGATLGDQDGHETEQGHGTESRRQMLPPLPGNPARLEKNIYILHALLEPDTLSTDNSDEAVNDFDDRIKTARGKAKVIEKMTGEQVPKLSASGAAAVAPKSE